MREPKVPRVPRIEVRDPLLGKLLDERYSIVERIGAGAMSTVYLADQVQGGPQVALKVLSDHLVQDADQRERFEREARALFGMDHPHILRVHDFGVIEGLPYLVMERLQGMTLDEMVESAPPTPEVAVDLTRQVLSGLAYAHAQGVLHRDLKSENVFITTGPDGRPMARLLDFGLVKFTDDNRWGEGKALTAYGEVFGTPAYMSPEQCTGAPVDARSDVYAMGIVLFELLTGAWPFMEETRVGMMRAHLTASPPHMHDVRPELRFRPELEQVVQTALAKEQNDRFSDAGQMLAALEAVVSPYAVSTQGEVAAAYTPQVQTALGAPPAAPAPSSGGIKALLLVLGIVAGLGLLVVVAAVVIALVLQT